jgi:hypothetical protein
LNGIANDAYGDFLWVAQSQSTWHPKFIRRYLHQLFLWLTCSWRASSDNTFESLNQAIGEWLPLPVESSEKFNKDNSFKSFGKVPQVIDHPVFFLPSLKDEWVSASRVASLYRRLSVKQ